METDIYEERYHVMKSWFMNWTDYQRRIFLRDLICNVISKPQREYVSSLLTVTATRLNTDFTLQVPHSVTVLILSYLDPRSLCRCAQVCWYWKCLSELNEVWMPKCVKLGWCLPINSKQAPEPNAWKQLFTRNFLRLRHVSHPVIKHSMPTAEIATMTELLLIETSARTKEEQRSELTPKQRPKSVNLRSRSDNIPSNFMTSYYNSRPSSVSSLEQKPSSDIIQLGKKHPPWRSSARKPRELIRYNYLDNDNVIWELNQERVKLFGSLIE